MELEEITAKYFQLEKLSAMNFQKHCSHFIALLESLEKKEELNIAAALAMIEAQHYKHISQIDGIRDEAKKYAQALLSKVIEYGKKSK